ncbi:MAG TPA: competence/damage-inducible protein A [Gemmatimonadales bacterium]|nr:competence/damage-inducible protein A [Gemmatimonadales bacterium]
MKLEAVTVGTELLLGYTLDTNAADIGRQLGAIGVAVVRRTSVGDEPAAIQSAVADALARTGAVLITGGLGPTRDDVTKHTVAALFDAPLEFVPEAWQALVARFARIGRTAPEANRSQAMVPRGATILPNRWGTAPGLWLEGGPGLAIMLPGVPHEMRGLLEHEVAPRLARRAGDLVVRSRTLRTTAIPESALAERLGAIEDELTPLTLAYLPGLDGVDLRVTSWGAGMNEADLRLAVAIDRLRSLAGPYAYGEDEADLAAEVLAAAGARSMHLAVAESCTGGLVGARLTAIPGSSAVFRGGTIAYDNAVKRKELGVPVGILRRHGAVSEQVAAAMARGAAKRFGTELAVAVTGIAGPDGGTAEKPVGTVCFATLVDGEAQTTTSIIPGSRGDVRGRAAQTVLYLLLRRLLPA